MATAQNKKERTRITPPSDKIEEAFHNARDEVHDALNEAAIYSCKLQLANRLFGPIFDKIESTPSLEAFRDSAAKIKELLKFKRKKESNEEESNGRSSKADCASECD